MYEEFYGFREKPFSLLPDPEFLYFSAKHRSAFSVLEYGLTGQAGFTIISGEVGSGKTTLVQSFLRQVGTNTNIGLINNTPRSFDSLMKWILVAFNLDFHGLDTVELHRVFTDFLVAQNAGGRRSMLIIDEAQNLDAETLEELRILSNVNFNKNLLLQIVLVGQPELMDLLNRPELRQFTQRISISYQLEPLTREETQAYIRHRLAVAGGDPMTFTGGACDAVYYLSKGIPRLINGLCDIALVYGFGENKPNIDVEIVLSVYDDRSQSGLGMGADRLDTEQLTKELQRLGAEANDNAAELATAPIELPTDAGDPNGADHEAPLADDPYVDASNQILPDDDFPRTAVRSGAALAENVAVSWQQPEPQAQPYQAPSIVAPQPEQDWPQRAPIRTPEPSRATAFEPEYDEQTEDQIDEGPVIGSRRRQFVALAVLVSVIVGLWFVLTSTPSVVPPPPEPPSITPLPDPPPKFPPI